MSSDVPQQWSVLAVNIVVHSENAELPMENEQFTTFEALLFAWYFSCLNQNHPKEVNMLPYLYRGTLIRCTVQNITKARIAFAQAAWEYKRSTKGFCLTIY